jgi:hypothetical protein
MAMTEAILGMTLEDGRVIITPQGDKPLSLADRLALFDPAVPGGEVMSTRPLGKEKWQVTGRMRRQQGGPPPSPGYPNARQ